MFKTNFIIERSNKKNIFACLLIAVFVFGLMLFVKSEDIGNTIKDKGAEYQSLSSALSKFQNVDATELGDGSELYKNLVKQHQAVSKQVMAVKMNLPELFMETALELVDLRDSAFDMEGYEDVAAYLPTKVENQLSSVFYDFINKNGSSLSADPLSYFQYLAFLFSIIGSIWFVFISLFSSNIMIEDFQHTTIIKGYPITFDKYVLAKCLSSIFIVIFFVIELFICSLPLIYSHGLGDASYPVAVFNGIFEVYPITKYIVISLLYMIFIAVFTILLSVILNMLLKNMYLTLFVQLLLYILPVLFPNMISLVPFNPFNYFNFTNVLNGHALDLANPVALNSTHGLIYIGISIVVMIVAVKLFVTTGKLKKV